jgi:lysophospholipase L1-like esterase
LCLAGPVRALAAPPPAPVPPAAVEKKDGPDWANLRRYQDANAQLGPPARGENRVVIIGASIMENWGHHTEQFFPGKPFVDRGISGQTTAQVLLRFRQDVIHLKPKVVLINVGVNDIAQDQGPDPLRAMENNYASMVDLARANGIRVVLSSVTPAREIPWRREIDAGPSIQAVNAWLKDYAARHGVVYVDFFSALAEPDRSFRANLTSDGVHPTAAGYAVMAPLAEEAIDEALKKPL